VKFKVTGADRETGEDREIIIEAMDAQNALEEANNKGLMVAGCVGIADDASDATKLCPFCAEMIKSKAIKCRWCGEMLNNTAPTLPSLPHNSVAAMKCPECHASIAGDVGACPHCGYPVVQAPVQPPTSATCRLTVVVAIGKLWTFNLTKDAGSVELGGRMVKGPAKSGFSCQFALPPGEHILKTSMDGGSPGKFRINLPEPGEYELSLGMNQMGGTLFGTPKLAVKRLK
jgi:hypothetical protein